MNLITRNYLKYLTFLTFFLTCFLSQAQNYVQNSPISESQSFVYSPDNLAINHVYSEGVSIFPDLNKITFSIETGAFPNITQTPTYGYNTPDPVPTSWSIIDGSSSVSSGITYNHSTNELTYEGNCNEEIVLQVDIDIDGDGISDIDNVRFRYQIICDFTLVQSYLNSCTNTYVIQMNEVALPASTATGDARFPCRDYELFLYQAANYPDGDLYGGSSMMSDDGQFDLSNLPIGNYVYYVENQCGQTFPNPEISSAFPATFSIAEGYNFGSNVVFTGYECYEDEESVVDITLINVALPLDSWVLLDEDGNTVYSSATTDVEDEPDLNFMIDGEFSTEFSIETISLSITGLAPGEYTFNFVDALGCTETNTFDVIRPSNPLTAEETIFNVSCPSGSDGAVQFFLTGGWTEPFENNPFYPDEGENPIWGNYLNFVLSDADFNEYEYIQFSFDGDGYNIGYIGLPAGTYTFSYEEVVAQNAVDEEILYTCTNEVTIEITEPDPFDIVSEVINDAQCDEEASGSINTTSSGGTPFEDSNNENNCILYCYNWTASNGGQVPEDQESNQNISGLVAGTYTLTITDANGCSYSESFDVNEPDPLVIVYDSKQDVSCFGGSDGSITVIVNGGTPYVDPENSEIIDYNFTIFNDLNQPITNFTETYNGGNSFTLSGLIAGTYTVVVTDQNGCEADQVIEVTIEEPDEITYTIDQTTLLDCYGDSDGEITITVSGGTPGYSLSLTGTSTASGSISSDGGSYTFSGLTVGTYSIIVQDANFVSSPSGCDVTTESLIIDEPEELIISNLSATEILCNADETSTITGTITGGTANYEVVLIGPGVNEVSSDNTGSINFTDLGAGTYTVQVSDTNIATGGSGCYVEQSITIDEPDQLTISGVTSAYPDPNESPNFGVTEFGATDGTIDITVEGGTLPYSFQWTVISGGPISGSTTSEDLFNLPAGVYNVLATDDNGCTIEMEFEITEPEPFLIFEDLPLHVDVDCYGDSTGELGVYVTGGTAPYDFEIANTTGVTPVVIDAVTNIDGNEYSITGLEAGEYTLSSEDANNVLISTQIIILQPDAAIDIEETISDYNGYQISCFGADNGTISVAASGGGGTDNTTTYSYTWKRDNNSFAPQSPSTPDNIVGLSPGVYEVTVTDDVGCTYTETYVIDQPDPLTVSATLSDYSGFNISINGEDDGFINLNITGGVESYSFSWSTSDGNILSGQETNQNLTDLVAGTYNVTITDQNNCSVSDSFTLIEPNELTIEENIAAHTDVNCFGDSTGTLGINISGGIPPYTYVLENSVPIEIDRLVGQTDLFYTYTSGLQADIYTVSVIDVSGATNQIEITILQPDAAIDIEETISDYNGYQISCFGASDGTIEIVITGGGGPSNSDQYTYQWTLGVEPFTVVSPSTDTSLQDLGPGIYEVTVTDDVGCTYTETYEITEPPALTLSGVVSDYNGFGVSCFGQDDGFIDITIGGGTSSYTYAWSTSDGVVPAGQETNQNLTDLVAGTYTVTIADSNGCPIAETFIISQPDEFLITEVATSHIDVLCYGENSGEFEVSIVETVGPYDYLLTGTDYLGNAVNQSSISTDLNVIYDELFAGNYNVFVTDQNGCSTELLDIIILQPIAAINIEETISEFNGFNISCFGVSDGTIEIVTTGGGGPSNSDQYTYQWTLGGDSFTVVSPSTDTSLQDLGPGIYEVTVTDDVGCTYTETYEITEPEDIVIIVDSEVDILCNGNLTGSISITPQGGTGDYTYYWTYDPDGSGGQQFDDIEDIENLGPGEYVVLVEDSNGCFESEVFEITQPEAIVITVESTVDILCHGDFTGSIDVSIVGGIPDYDINWSGPNSFESTDEDLTDLEAGIYTLQVTDQNNCLQTIEVELTQPDDLIINYNVTNETCTNANDGSISLDIQGGVLDYVISWSNFGNGPNQNNLAPGLYTATVTDGNNCLEEVTIEIEAAPIFDIDPEVNSISCFGNGDGNIQLNIQGGVSPLFVLWDDDPTAGEDRFNLGPGIYSVTISDSSDFNCVIEREFVIVEPSELNSSGIITNALDCDIVNSGSIDLQVTGGTAPYIFDWSNGAVTEDLIGIPPGNYAVIITDINGCKIIDEFEVTRPDEITTDLVISFDADCENRIPYQITTIQINGGVPPYDISWSSGNISGANNETMTTSFEGTVIVDIVDSLGCSSQITFDVELFELGYPDFSYDSFTLSNCGILSIDDPIQFTNLSSGDYQSVEWNFGDGFISNEENPLHIYDLPGTYYITQTVNYPYGCSYDIIKEITITKGYEIILPNAFTPNSDTINDTIRPVFNCMTNVQMSIYDTWGSLIYAETSDGDIYGWDGTIDGKPAENGNYILVVKAESWNGKVVELNGPITLIK